MDDLRSILTGHGHNVFQYLKCLLDQSEKDKKMYSVQWVLYGIIVIGHVYTMILCHTRCIERAKSVSTRAIGLYIEFIAQLSMIDTHSSSSYTPYTIGCKDAASFVYKKVFPDTPYDYTCTDVLVSDPAKLSQSQVDNYLEVLHEYKQIIQNMIRVLFSNDLFNDKRLEAESPLYYGDVIGGLLQVIARLDQTPICISLYRDIVSSQCNNNKPGVHTENMTPKEYSVWMIGIICH